MLNMSNYGNTGKLAAAVKPEDTQIRVMSGGQFTVPQGDHYYLTIRESGRREVVRVNSTSGGWLTVERAQDGTMAQGFSLSACLEVEWNPQQLREFLDNGQSPNVISPGVYCLSCNTCITIDSSGRITDVNGAEGC